MERQSQARKLASTDARSVILLLPYGVLGAAEDYVLLLADGLADRGWRVFVAHPLSVPIDESRTSLAWDPIGIPDAAMVRPRALTSYLRPLRPDLVHVNQVVLPSIAAGTLMRDCALVVTAHNPALQHRYSLKGRALAALLTNRPDAWIVLSDRNRSLLIDEHVRPRAIHVVPPGLPPARFDAPLSADDARASLGLPAGVFVVGTVGRLAQQKRHDVLIKAVSTLTTKIPELHLVIVGDGELREQTERLASRLIPDNVTFAGQRSDVPRLLVAFDILAMSSDFEGLPFAILEAMAAGRTIVTTDVQGAGEAVRNEREGLLVPRRDPDALATAIGRLATVPALAAKLAGAARVRFLQEFTADLMVERTEKLYLQVVAANGRRPR